MDIQPFQPRNQVLGFVAWLAQQGLREAYRRGNRAVQRNLRNRYEAYRARQDALREYDRLDREWQKRQKTSQPDTSNQDPPSDMPMNSTGNVGQWGWIRDQCSAPVKKRIRITPQTLTKYIWRWQSLSNFAVPPAQHVLACVRNTTTGKHDLPMYCFDLSSLPAGYITSDAAIYSTAYSVPFYRLSASKSAVGNPNDEAYSWTAVQGINNDPTGAVTNYISSLEDVDNPRADLYPKVSKYRHDYSDIRLSINGCTTTPTRVHVKIVRFLDNDYAPRRQYVASSATSTLVQYDDAVTDGDKNRIVGGFWDQFWAHRESNPLRSVRNEIGQPIYHVVYHKTIDFVPTNTTDSDTRVDQRIMKLFFKDGHCHNTDTGILDALQDNTVFGNAGANYGYKAFQGPTVGDQYNLFPESKHCYFMLVYQENWVKNDNGANTATNPSFDLLVRNTFTVPNQG